MVVILSHFLHKVPLHFSYLTFVFRQECNKLREELRLQHEEDKKAAMTQLLQLKEREKNAARDGWQKKVEDLLDQVTIVSLRIGKPLQFNCWLITN